LGEGKVEMDGLKNIGGNLKENINWKEKGPYQLGYLPRL